MKTNYCFNRNSVNHSPSPSRLVFPLLLVCFMLSPMAQGKHSPTPSPTPTPTPTPTATPTATPEPTQSATPAPTPAGEDRGNGNTAAENVQALTSNPTDTNNTA